MSAEVFEGLTLITSRPNDNEGDNNVVLINNDGNIINEWITDCEPASIAYLQQDSTLIYPCKDNRSDRLPEGGRIIKYSWDNLILWDYSIPEELGIAHHDIEVLNNGNILVILLETKTYEDAINSGRIDIDGNFSLDYIIELEPFGIDGANIIWEWL
ncbi:MAG: hypothetical protein H8D94_00015 [Candidatus Pelagibacter sp.]|nr:hypothetical protein [Candidatus Pelagibacter sp.]